MRLGLFTADQVCALCGVSHRQLAYWDKTGFFSPRYANDEKRPFNRIYSFRDVVCLRTIGLLRNKYHVPLTPDLRHIAKELKKIPDADWAQLVFFKDPAGRVYFRHPASGEILATSPVGQRPLFRMRAVIRHVERNLSQMNDRKPRQIGRIEQHRYVVRNEPTIAGTRVPAAAICRLHQAGYSTEQITKEFPRLKPADIQAAIEHERVRTAS
jgi:uncharacterized protein (DUF433 family)